MTFSSSTRVLLLAVALAACDNQGPPLETPCVTGEITISVRVLPLDELRDAYPLSTADGETIYGFTVLTPEPRTVYVPELRGQNDMTRFRTWGHEFAHAVCGAWHPEGRP